MVFGGLGANIFNPAMVGRAFLTASFGMMMTSWTVPATINQNMPRVGSDEAYEAEVAAAHKKGYILIRPDARTQATPLALSKQAIKDKTGAQALSGQLKAMFTGEVGGCLGETSALALLIGGIYLLIDGR
ncbi:unnamed protein product, partial [marine sediment metagenome]